MPFHILYASLIELIEKWDNVICCSSDGVNSCAGLKYELVGDSYLTGGELNAYLADIDRQAEEIFFRLVKEKADAEGITEALKASNQMQWVGRMNSAEIVHPHDLLIQSVRPIYIHTVSSANQVFPISLIADDTTVSLEHKCHIDRSDLKHYNACETQILAYDTEAYHEPGFNARPCHQVHAAVCHPHDFRGSIAAVL